MDVNVLFKWIWFGKEMISVFTVSNGDDSPSFLEALRDALLASTQFGDFVSILHSGINLSEVGVRYSAGGEIVTNWATIDLDGQVLAEPCPPIVAPVVSFIYAGTRPNRGRCYLPGLTEASCDDGLVDSAFRTAVESWFTEWAVSGIAVEGYGDCFLRIGRRNAQGHLISSNPVTSVICRQNPGRRGSRRPSAV